MAEEITKTGIDALVEYLKSHGETDASTLAQALGVSEVIIEKWSNILEKSNIVKISYRAGKMYVAPLAVTKEGLSEIQHKIEIKKESLINEATAQINLINQMSEQMKQLTKFVEAGEKVFKEKMGPLKKDLDELYKLSDIAEKRYNEVKAKKREIDGIAERLNKEISGLKERAVAIEKFELDTTNAEKLIEDIRSKIELMRKLAEEEDERRRKAMRELEESEAKLIRSINEEIDAINENLLLNERELDEGKRRSEESKRSAIKLKKELEEMSNKVSEEVIKDKEEVDRDAELVEKRYSELKFKIDDLRNSLGDVAKVDELLRNVQKTVEELNKNKDALLDELNKVLAEAKAIDALSKEDIVKSTKKLDELQGKTADTKERIGEMQGKLSKTEEDISNMKG